MQIQEYMSTQVIFANLDDGLHQTFHRMQERGIRHMPVLNEDETLAGFVSDRDLRRPNTLKDTRTQSEYYALDNDTTVQEVMTKDPVVVRPGDNVQNALQIFISAGYGALPVVDDARHVVGIVSNVDLLRAFQDHLSKTA